MWLINMKGLIGVWTGVFLDYLTTWIGFQYSFTEANPHASPLTYGLITTVAFLVFELLRNSCSQRILEAFRLLVTSMVFYPCIHNVLVLSRIL
jgi:hypothetical protein